MRDEDDRYRGCRRHVNDERGEPGERTEFASEARIT
jgi:hypothetical protein